MTGGAPTWTPERHAILCQLFAESLTLSVIAYLMGLTKNTIVGRCNRNGLKRGRRGILSETVVNRRRLRKAVKRAEHLKSLRRVKPAMIIEAEIEAEIAAIPDDYAGPTSMERLQALHDRMDAAMRECGR